MIIRKIRRFILPIGRALDELINFVYRAPRIIPIGMQDVIYVANRRRMKVCAMPVSGKYEIDPGRMVYDVDRVVIASSATRWEAPHEKEDISGEARRLVIATVSRYFERRGERVAVV